MLKILYAASNHTSAKIQLARFIKAIEGKPYIVKVAAYKNSSPKINIDWTLDCLLNIYKPDHLSLDNDNFNIYLEQVKYFNPDLIITDLEYFTSQVANILDITLWQCSSTMINFALSHNEKYNLGAFKYYSYALNKNPLHTQRTVNLIDNSNCNFVYSHLVDTENPPTLKNSFMWVRPYYTLGKYSIPCQHNIVAAALENNKRIVQILKNHTDSVLFSDFVEEHYSKIAMKDIGNDAEYACNLKNSRIFMCEGQTSFLADAFYNHKYSLILTDLKNPECIINAAFSDKMKIGHSIYGDVNVDDLIRNQILVRINDSCKFLHERIEEI